MDEKIGFNCPVEPIVSFWATMFDENFYNESINFFYRKWYALVYARHEGTSTEC